MEEMRAGTTKEDQSVGIALDEHRRRDDRARCHVECGLGDRPGEVTRAPLLGEHTDEVLAALGYDTVRLAELRRLDAI